MGLYAFVFQSSTMLVWMELSFCCSVLSSRVVGSKRKARAASPVSSSEPGSTSGERPKAWSTPEGGSRGTATVRERNIVSLCTFSAVFVVYVLYHELGWFCRRGPIRRMRWIACIVHCAPECIRLFVKPCAILLLSVVVASRSDHVCHHSDRQARAIRKLRRGLQFGLG